MGERLKSSKARKLDERSGGSGLALVHVRTYLSTAGKIGLPGRIDH